MEEKLNKDAADKNLISETTSKSIDEVKGLSTSGNNNAMEEVSLNVESAVDVPSRRSSLSVEEDDEGKRCKRRKEDYVKKEETATVKNLAKIMTANTSSSAAIVASSSSSVVAAVVFGGTDDTSTSIVSNTSPKSTPASDYSSQDVEDNVRNLGSPGPKVPPLKIVIPPVECEQGGSRNGKNTARHHGGLPYVVVSSEEATTATSTTTTITTSPCSPSVSTMVTKDEIPSPTSVNVFSEEQKIQQRVLRSTHSNRGVIFNSNGGGGGCSSGNNSSATSGCSSPVAPELSPQHDVAAVAVAVKEDNSKNKVEVNFVAVTITNTTSSTSTNTTITTTATATTTIPSSPPTITTTSTASTTTTTTATTTSTTTTTTTTTTSTSTTTTTTSSSSSSSISCAAAAPPPPSPSPPAITTTTTTTATVAPATATATSKGRIELNGKCKVEPSPSPQPPPASASTLTSVLVKIKSEIEEDIKPIAAEIRITTEPYHNKDGVASAIASSSSAAAAATTTTTTTVLGVELHPRKRKLKSKQESSHVEGEQLSSFGSAPHPHEVPVTNCYQMFMDIRRQIDVKRKGLFPIQPKPPQGFKDYLMNRCTYTLAGNSVPRLKRRNADPPDGIADGLKALYQEQETERYSLRMQHVVEKEKLVLSVEQEILRVHGRAARALANQALPFSACTILKDEEVYNVITPEQEEKDRNARSRYNGRLFISWLQDVDDKWEKIKEEMLSRHHKEAESLNAIQKFNWDLTMRKLGLRKKNALMTIEESCVPMISVSDDFDLLPE